MRIRSGSHDQLGSGTSGTARVITQIVYDAYGRVIGRDDPATPSTGPPELRVGHKGLFFDRLDVGVADTAVPGAGAQETPRLVPFAHAIYHNRNRAYNPQFGRFMQPDPNASALAMLEGASYNGRGVAALAVAFDLTQRYGDGANLYQYLGSNPWNRSDPMGLSWDPFSMVDEMIAEHAANSATFLSALGNGAKSTAVLAAHIASYLPFPAAGLAGELALAALGEQSMETAMIAAGLGLIPAGKLLGPAFSRVGKFIGRAASAAWGAAKHYAGKAGRYLSRMHPGGGNVDRAAKWMSRKRMVPGTCGCFAAATMVWASGGLVPIEQIELGDEVLAFNEATGATELREVTNVIVTHSAALLLLNVEHADGRMETIRTTDEHPFWVLNAGGGEASSPAAWGRWVRADQLAAGDALETLAGPSRVTSLAFTQERRTVYNLTVDGLHTFRVGDDGVLVHNCYRQLFIEMYEKGGRKFPAGHQVHHRIPQKYRDMFPDEVDDLNNWVGVPQRIHGQINGAWNTFRARNQNPTSNQVLDFVQTIDAQFGQHYLRP